MKDIVVFLDASPASEERLRLATHIARNHGACLSAIFAHNGHSAEFTAGVAARHGLVGQFISGTAGTRRRTKSAEGIEERMRESHRRVGAGGEWHDADQLGPARLIEFTRTADLTIIGQANRDAPHGPRWRPDSIVLASGRPVLIVPYAGTFTELGHRVLVAWDGSGEAARALNDALPLICTARAVTVMTVRNRERDLQRSREATQRVLRHLARHEIPARADHPLRGDNAISDVLLSAAMDISADLIVAGAYHHSPLRQALIGGVSRELLQHMTVPVLMSH